MTSFERDRWTTAVEILKAYLKDELLIARLLKEHKWAELAAVAEVAEQDADPTLAQTDPALYKALRDAVTLYNLKGYRVLDRSALEAMARGENSPAKG